MLAEDSNGGDTATPFVDNNALEMKSLFVTLQSDESGHKDVVPLADTEYAMASICWMRVPVLTNWWHRNAFCWRKLS